MKIDFTGFADQVVAELKATGTDFWDQFTDEQRDFIEERARRLVTLTGMKLTAIGDPNATEAIDSDIAHVVNTLTSEAAYTALLAEQRVRKIIANVLNQTLDFAFKALSGL